MSKKKNNDKFVDISSGRDSIDETQVIETIPLNEDNSVTPKPKKKNKKNKKFKKWMKKHKVLTIIICIILVLLIAGGVWFAVVKSKSSGTSYSFIRTTTLAKGNLDDSISTTGTVESSKTSNVTTSLTYTVSSVNVAVGDKVKKGDTICSLDSSELEDQITKEQENLSKNQKSAQTSYDSAKTSYDSAVSTLNNYKSTLSDAKSDKASAYSPYKTAKNAISSYLSSYNSALSSYNNAAAAYVSAYSNYTSVLSKYKSGSASKTALYSAAKTYMEAVQNCYGNCSVGSYDISDGSSSSSSSSNSSNNNSSNGANGGSQSSNNSSNSASSTTSSVSVTQTSNAICNNVVSQVKSLTNKTLSYSSGSNALYKLSKKATALQNAKTNSNYTNLESSYQIALSAYESAKQTYDQYEDSVTQAKSQLSQASNELENASTSDTLENLQSQLDQCVLTAGQSGTVTALNATVGSAASGQQAIATIQDLDNLKVSITIEEANINSAKTYMSAYITSDASDATLNGTLTQIDPTSENGSFGAEVTVDSENSGLLIGMNASVELIVSSSEDVFQVPIDAIGTDDDDKGDYVYRQTGGEGTDMTFEKVYVTTGEKNDYYIEVESDDLSEGDVIRSTSDLSEGIETTSTGSDNSSSGFDLSSLFGGSSNDRGNMKMGNMGSGSSGGFPGGSSNSGSSSGSANGSNSGMPAGGAAPGGQ